MELHNLISPKENRKNRKRIGRGEGSGKGKQAGRGHKGQKSRSGYKQKAWFEGGQMPLQRRIPKFGFKNFNRKEYKTINFNDIKFIIKKHNIADKISIDDFIKHGYIRKKDSIKLLADGDCMPKLNIEIHAASKSAIKKVNDAKGTLKIVEVS